MRPPPCHAQGMSVVRLNMSHGDHKSHKAVVDLVREYNALDRGNLAIMLDTKGPEVRSGDLSEPIEMKAGGCHPATRTPVHTKLMCLAGQRQCCLRPGSRGALEICKCPPRWRAACT